VRVNVADSLVVLVLLLETKWNYSLSFYNRISPILLISSYREKMSVFVIFVIGIFLVGLFVNCFHGIFDTEEKLSLNGG